MAAAKKASVSRWVTSAHEVRLEIFRNLYLLHPVRSQSSSSVSKRPPAAAKPRNMMGGMPSLFSVEVRSILALCD